MRCWKKKNVLFLHFCFFFKNVHFLKKYDSRFLIFRAKYCVATFNFGIFPYIHGICWCMEKSENLWILLQTVGGNGAIKFFRKITFVSWCPRAYIWPWETCVGSYAGKIFVKFCIPEPTKTSKTMMLKTCKKYLKSCYWPCSSTFV